MNRRRKRDYRSVLNALKVQATRLGFELNPKSVMTDFEIGAMQAFQESFPGLFPGKLYERLL